MLPNFPFLVTTTLIGRPANGSLGSRKRIMRIMNDMQRIVCYCCGHGNIFCWGEWQL